MLSMSCMYIQYSFLNQDQYQPSRRRRRAYEIPPEGTIDHIFYPSRQRETDSYLSLSAPAPLSCAHRVLPDIHTLESGMGPKRRDGVTVDSIGRKCHGENYLTGKSASYWQGRLSR